MCTTGAEFAILVARSAQGVEETEMKQYVIGVDFGTLSARAALFDVGDGTQLAESVAA